VPTTAGKFTLAAKTGYGGELWMDSTQLAKNTESDGATIQGAPQTLTKGKAYKIQAFAAAVSHAEVGCFVKVPGGCTGQTAGYAGSYGDPEVFARDYWGEKARGAFYSKSACLRRKTDFDAYCKSTNSEMKFVSPMSQGPLLQLWVNGKPAQTAADSYRICSDKTCSDTKPAKQTKATETCECADWHTKAPKEWKFTAATGNACMRPVYDPKTAPWCYCKSGKPAFALCDPKLSASKGVLNIDMDSEDEWSES